MRSFDPPFLHLIALAAAASILAVSCPADYAVAIGVGADGRPVLPIACDDVRYLVPGGIEGLPYLARLGQEGSSPVQFTFPAPVAALVVATLSNLTPAVIAGPPAPPPVVQDPTLLSLFATGQRFDLPDNFGDCLLQLSWSEPTFGPKSPQYAHLRYIKFNSPDQAAVAFEANAKGKTLAELLSSPYFQLEPFAAS